MPHYKLYNKDTERDLKHPKIGLWNTTDLEIARGMRESFKSYLKQLGLNDCMENIIIKNIETDEEIM